MKQSKKDKRSRKSSDILTPGVRCIYCEQPATTIEHMPPVTMFKKRHRPSGMEFPSCETCNNGTSAADAAVGFLARIDRYDNDTESWKIVEAIKNLESSNRLMPGFTQELFGDENSKDTVLRTEAGLFIPVAEVHSGPICNALLNVFAAKLGMALYSEHIGEPLPLEGGVFGQWFLNNGLAADTAEIYLKILPTHSTLRQGRHKNSSGQFDYRYNSDDKTIVAALTHFHSNIHFFTIAMAEPSTYGFPERWKKPFSVYAQPGELLRIMPKRPPVILMPNFTEPKKPFKLRF